jgi:lysozyme
MSEISELLEKHEGRRQFPYYDTVGKLTIGIGHNLTDGGLPNEIIDLLFEYDIKDKQKQLSERLYWFDAQPDKSKLVLTDMAFNLGIAGLLTFHNTLEHIKNGEYKNAAEEMLLSKWAKQVGIRAIELSNILKSIT